MDAVDLGVLAGRVVETERVQSLWSGYGEIVRAHLDDGTTAIVKWARAPARANDVAHARRCRSYDVEHVWYRDYAARCPSRVPALRDARAGGGRWVFVLEDLDAAGFAGRRRRLSASELDACLAWLARLHARFVGVAPAGLWETGTYWHLATRPDELRAIDDAALRRAAPILDRLLRGARFQTIVHGDAKPANFCFADDGAVAALDFQYAGGGCGMSDVAYLLDEPEPGRALDAYFAHLRAAQPAVDAGALEAEWRALYPIAYADYARFLAGWAREHWRADRAAQGAVATILRRL
ncbi:MAG: phosphotransferase [Labilithrix sp.]|nr:phosphotransferase [Labilithrix sp.]MCW5809925.1 phosphotransferase [Labilithrix sp.]